MQKFHLVFTSPFVIISSSYLLYTITDGAIRMIVLLHAYNNFFSALEVAIMFTLYELAGVFTNLVSSNLKKKYIYDDYVCIFFPTHHFPTNVSFICYHQAAGFMGARWGIKFTLICGLSLQLFSYGLLFGWNDDWSKNQAIIYVTISQMWEVEKLSGNMSSTN